jgi:hypothetical protein
MDDDRFPPDWLTPSQTWYWNENESLSEMLTRTKESHHSMYGAGGRLQNRPQVGEGVFMAATEGLSRFILAAQMWLSGRILITEAGHIERHRRKDFERKVEHPIDAIKIVHLRRQETQSDPKVASQDASQDWYRYRFIVDGHPRNQACGPHFTDRKLIWIGPHIKGPADKPLHIPTHKVYVVDR